MLWVWKSKIRKSEMHAHMHVQICRSMTHLNMHRCTLTHTCRNRRVTETADCFQPTFSCLSLADIQCTIYPISSSGLIYFYSYIIDLLSGTVSI